MGTKAGMSRFTSVHDETNKLKHGDEEFDLDESTYELDEVTLHSIRRYMREFLKKKVRTYVIHTRTHTHTHTHTHTLRLYCV